MVARCGDKSYTPVQYSGYIQMTNDNFEKNTRFLASHIDFISRSSPFIAPL